MNGNSHFTFGTALGYATVAAANTLELNNLVSHPVFHITLDNSAYFSICFIATCLIGSIFPDIDNPKSNFGQLAAPISTVVGKVGKLTGKTGQHHRGIFHDPAVYLLGLILSYFYCLPLIGFFIGALGHLALDAFNPMGIRFFGTKFIRFGKIPSGSKESKIFTFLLSFVVLLFGFYFQFFYTRYPLPFS